MKRLILGFIVAVLIAAAVWALPAPTIYWEHNGVNLTHFQCQIDSCPLVALYGLVTQNGGTYSTALSNCGTLSAGCIAAPNASFAQPEIRLGLFAPPASVLLPRILGERRALGMLLSGDRIGADEALRYGFVNAVLADDDFHAAAAAWCSRLAELSGSALGLAKEAVRLARGRSAAEAHRLVERLYLDRLMTTRDANEGLDAFLARRAPTWEHR